LTQAEATRRYRSRLRQARRLTDDGYLWRTVSEVAREYQKAPITIARWCEDGFILTLGYRLKRDVTGHWLIGTPYTETRQTQPKPLT
jgi:hypothetical protein